MQPISEDQPDQRPADAPDRRPPDETPKALVIALMRNLRLIKRMHTPNIDPSLLFVLHLISEHQPVRLSELAARMHLDLSTASRHVRALENSGHLTREPDPDDRRAARISLTDDGRAELLQSFKERCRRLGEALTDWTDADVRDFERLLTRLADDLEKHYPEPNQHDFLRKSEK